MYTLRSSDLAACGDGNRARGYQNEIRHAEAVRGRYRRGDFTFDDPQPVGRIPVGVAALLEFDDGDQLLRVIVRDRYCRDSASCDLLDCRLDVVGRVVAPIHDQEVLDAADDE